MNLEKSKYRLVIRSTHYKFFSSLFRDLKQSKSPRPIQCVSNIFLYHALPRMDRTWLSSCWKKAMRWVTRCLAAGWWSRLDAAAPACFLCFCPSLCLFSTPVLDNKSKLRRGMCNMACNHARLLSYLSSNVHWWIPSSPRGIAVFCMFPASSDKQRPVWAKAVRN